MKIKKSNHNGEGTAFSFIVFRASAYDIERKVGKPNFRDPWNHEEKVTREWNLELEDGTPFTIYDWKEYRVYSDTEKIEWHVGTRYCLSDDSLKDNDSETKKVYDALVEAGFMVSKQN